MPATSDVMDKCTLFVLQHSMSIAMLIR